jgi:hypothetical protein
VTNGIDLFARDRVTVLKTVRGLAEDSMSGRAVVYLESARIRAASREFVNRRSKLMHQARAETDRAVILRAETRRLLSESSRIKELIHQRESQSYPIAIEISGNLRDAAVYEDRELLEQLNRFGFSCDKCGSDAPLAAVVEFNWVSTVMALCGSCFQQLSALSLGQVT